MNPDGAAPDIQWLTVLLTGAVSIVIVIVALGFRRRPPTPTGGDGSLNRTVDELTGLADRLEALIDEADRKIESLGGLIDAGGSSQSPLARKVCALADEGLTSIEIAGRLDEEPGKIELILALRDSEADT